MAKQTTVAAAEAVEQAVPETPEVNSTVNSTVNSEANTKWGEFNRAAVAPLEIMCQAYRPMHAADMSCHTRLRFDPKILLTHIKGDHGGGFQFRLRPADKEWPGWELYKKANLEVVDFRCEICDMVLDLTPNDILKHMKPHKGKVRKTLPGGIFNLTLSHGIQKQVSPIDEVFDDGLDS